MSPAALYAATVIAALAFGGMSIWQVQDWRYGAIISTHALKAAQAETRRAAEVALAEKRLQEHKQAQEITDDINQKNTAELSARLRTAVGAGRLRDPNARACPAAVPGAAADTGAGAAHDPEAAGLLSEDITRLLARVTREADQVNLAYISCRADSAHVRGVAGEP